SGLCYEELQSEWKNMVFGTIIHRDSLIESSGVSHLPMRSFAPHSVAATLYDQLVDELLTKMEMTDAVQKASSERMA
ncbi:MAG: hypothetical protein LC729_03895, partial [Acidobacteria bacterium]|nr:hypothetical protein [Acidobacteriota bacterium]